MTFRKASNDRAQQREQVTIPAAQPVIVCLQSVLFKLQPGLVLTHKPPPTTSSRPQKFTFRTCVALLTVAVPAAAVAVFASRGGSVPQPIRQPAILAETSTPGPRVSFESPPPGAPAGVQTRQNSGVATQQQAPAMPLRQQVAYAQEVMMQLRGAVWYGLRHASVEGRARLPPAVFHVTVAQGRQADPLLVPCCSLPFEIRRSMQQFSVSLFRWNHHPSFYSYPSGRSRACVSLL